MLRELGELGMALARNLTRRTLEAPDDAEASAGADAGARAASRAVAGPRHDPAESLARLSRAVRLTLALEARIEEELSALTAGDMDGAAQSPAAAGDGDDDDDGGFHLLPVDHPSVHRNRIRDAVFDVINHEITDLLPAQEILDTLYERLIEGGRDGDFVHSPRQKSRESLWNQDNDPAYRSSTPSDSGPGRVRRSSKVVIFRRASVRLSSMAVRRRRETTHNLPPGDPGGAPSPPRPNPLITPKSPHTRPRISPCSTASSALATRRPGREPRRSVRR